MEWETVVGHREGRRRRNHPFGQKLIACALPAMIGAEGVIKTLGIIQSIGTWNCKVHPPSITNACAVFWERGGSGEKIDLCVQSCWGCIFRLNFSVVLCHTAIIETMNYSVVYHHLFCKVSLSLSFGSIKSNYFTNHSPIYTIPRPPPNSDTMISPSPLGAHSVVITPPVLQSDETNYFHKSQPR